ncbi:hypothetical protein PIB30_040574 [Stylosanthes scabra]|uniref:Uncharacterized protein n=1 Tax=Stylosanthes scabra TaxID=79078 RepID=A0ABU6YFC8_9FABA|nr:hypothetical protein [Stylosanthes scabra]
MDDVAEVHGHLEHDDFNEEQCEEEHENLSTMEVDQEEVVAEPLLEELLDEATNEEPELELDAEEAELAEELEWDLFREDQDEDEFGNFANDNAHRVDSVEDIAMIDFFELAIEDLLKFHMVTVIPKFIYL